MSRSIYSFVFLVFPLCSQMVFGAQKSNFLIIGSPEKADLLNQYEMQLSDQKKKELPAGIPFQIVNAQELMGDQIRQGMHLQHFSTPYYILLDDNGKTTGLPSSAQAETFRNCSIIYDTVTVVISAIKVYDRYPSKGKTTLLKKGTQIIRLFKYRNATYINRLSPPGMYGWTHVKNSSFKHEAASSSNSNEDFLYLHGRIMRRLEQINSRYDSLFTFFNSVTKQQKSIPMWNYERNGTIHRYSLSGADETIAQLAGSTRYIVGEIEKFLLGKPFAVSYADGVITVSRR